MQKDIKIAMKMICEFTKNKKEDDIHFNKLVVPPYQRRYEWDIKNTEFIIEEVKDFIENFKKFQKKNENRGFMDKLMSPQAREEIDCLIYLGNVVLSNAEDGNTEVIDGQQRLTTIFLFLHAFRFLKDKVKRGLSKIKGSKEIWTAFKETIEIVDADFTTAPFLKSEEEKDDYYLETIVNADDFESLENFKAEKGRPFTRSKHFKNLKLIHKELKENLDDIEVAIALYGVLTMRFGITMASGNHVAFDIFEKLNSRGLALSQSDLIKNILFKHLLNDENFDCKGKWDDMVMDFFNNNDKDMKSGKITDFLRWVLMTEKGDYFPKKKIYEVLSGEISKAESKTSTSKEKAKEWMDIFGKYALLWNDYMFKSEHSLDIRLIQSIRNTNKIYRPLTFFFLKSFNDKKICKEVLRAACYSLEKHNFVHSTLNNLPSKELDKIIPKVVGKLENSLFEEENKGVAKQLEVIKKEFTIIFEETYDESKGRDWEMLLSNLKTPDKDKRELTLKLYEMIWEHDDIVRKGDIEFGTKINWDKLDLEHLMPQDMTKWADETVLNLNEGKELLENEWKKMRDASTKLGNLFLISKKINRSIKNNIYKKKIGKILEGKDAKEFVKEFVPKVTEKIQNIQMMKDEDDVKIINEDGKEVVVAKTLMQSGLFKHEMEKSFGNDWTSKINDWNIEQINKRTEFIHDFIRDNDILNFKKVLNIEETV